MEKVIIIGASGHGKVIAETIEINGNYEIYGFIDTYKKVGSKILNYKVIGDESIISTLISEHNIRKGIISIGDNWIRKKMHDTIQKIAPNFSFISVIHPTSTISKYASIGKGCVIMPQAIINTDAEVGDFCIINTKASVGHDCTIENYSSLASGVTLGGNVVVSKFSAISLGATILQNRIIGEHSIVGAGALVTKNIDPNSISYGIPAKHIAARKIGDPYLTFKKNTTKKKTKEYNLFVKDLKTLEEINVYKELLTNYWCNNVYYTYEYLKYYENSTDELRYFLLTEDGIPATIMPFYIRKIDAIENYKDVITPYGYGGPLCKDCSKTKILNHFWSMVDSWYNKNNIVSEFVRFNLNGNHVNYTGELSATLRNVKGTVKENDEDQWTAFSTKVRNNYRKAEKHELTFKLYEGNEITDSVIENFHKVYIETMDRNNAKEIYYFPKQYFENLIHANPNSFAIAKSYKDNVVASVELIIINNNTLYAFLGGTRAKYFECRPNDYLRVEILKWAVQQEKKFYILGGGLKDDDGLYKSKKVFFPKDDDVVFYTGRKIINKEIYDSLSEPIVSATACDEVCNYFPVYRRPY
ncbi:MAG: NeuD/PglB/VioB family sugar acetyltransferase [Cellulophaga sp.]